MPKVTTLKKSGFKSCRLPPVELPSAIMQAVQVFIQDKGYTMDQFWKEAATYRLQLEEVKESYKKLDQIRGQIDVIEDRIREIENRESLLIERENNLKELEPAQDAILEERAKELEDMAETLEEENRIKPADLKETGIKQQEDYNQRLAAVEKNEFSERYWEYRRYLEMEFREKEKEIIKREAHIEARDAITTEKERFWSVMYDAMIKLARVCGSLK